jgi:hypothetical protein
MQVGNALHGSHLFLILKYILLGKGKRYLMIYIRGLRISTSDIFDRGATVLDHFAMYAINLGRRQNADTMKS